MRWLRSSPPEPEFHPGLRFPKPMENGFIRTTRTGARLVNRTQEYLYELNLYYVQTAKEVAISDPDEARLMFRLTRELVRALVHMPFERIDEFIRLHMPSIEPIVRVVPGLDARDALRQVAVYYADADFEVTSEAHDPAMPTSELKLPPSITTGATTKIADLVYRLNKQYLQTQKSVIAIDIAHAVAMFDLTLSEAEIIHDNPMERLAHYARLDAPLFKPVLRSRDVPRDFMTQLHLYKRQNAVSRRGDYD